MCYNDPDFGTVQVTVNHRARRIIMRPVVDGLRVTVPPRIAETEIIKTINEFRDRLKVKWEKVQQRHVTTHEEEEKLRALAKAQLPRRVAELAYMYGFKYTSLKIQSSKTRWGSCSGRNSINLSLYLMKVPEHLIDYVILHELCHTVHHDHSPNFWALMDEVTGGKAHALRAELKAFDTM